jgi:two-component system KDP operon response regulator KdpE
VDDEPQILRALRTSLSAHGYQVTTASDGESALNALALALPEVVILDLGLPDMEGHEVIRQVREFAQTPIIILSVREGERDKVRALDLGADDYLTKPFSMDELLARVRVALRHAAQAGGAREPVLHFGPLTIDLARHVVMRDGEEVHLTATEYRLLAYLASNAGRVLTHRMILQHVWGPEYATETQYLRVYVGQLRRKLEPDPSQPIFIATEPGVGYRFLTGE